MKRGFWISLILTALGTTAPADEPVIIAHRGASGYLPEHTLEAVAMAHAQGATYIEQDVVLTRDRVPVVLHDVQIDAVTDAALKFPDRKRDDGRWYAIDFTLAELKTLNVTERKNPRTGKPAFPNRFPAGRGTFRIPTLDEELQLIGGLNASTGRVAGIYPELKAPAWHREQGMELAPEVLKVLALHGYAEKDALCYLQCFEFAELRKVRETLGYRGKLVYLMGGRAASGSPDPNTDEGLKTIARTAQGIGPALPMVLRKSQNGDYEPTDLVKKAHEAGLKVHPYTIRTDSLPPGLTDPQDPFRLILGVAGADGVFTDQPDQGTTYLRAHPSPPRQAPPAR